MKKISSLTVVILMIAGINMVQADEKNDSKTQVTPAKTETTVVSEKAVSKQQDQAKKVCPKKAASAEKAVCPKTGKAKKACSKKAAGQAPEIVIVETEEIDVVDPTVSPAPELWDFLEFGFWFDVPSSTKNSNVYGIKIGAPFCSGQGKVNGIETAVFCGATENIKGLQACILGSISKRLDGVQFSIVNYCEEVTGLQLGVVNIAKKKSFQLGIVNYIEDGAIPFMPVVNFRF